MADNVQTDAPQTPGSRNIVLIVISWLWVGIPLAWGVLETLNKSLDLFR